MKSGGFLNVIEFSRRETFRGVDHDVFCKLQLATKLKSIMPLWCLGDKSIYETW
jgi:hypothetical protein